MTPLSKADQKRVREEIRELVREMFVIRSRDSLRVAGDDEPVSGEAWNVHFEPFERYAGLWMDDDNIRIILRHAAEARIALRKRIERLLEDLGLLDETERSRRGPHCESDLEFWARVERANATGEQKCQR